MGWERAWERGICGSCSKRARPSSRGVVSWWSRPSSSSSHGQNQGRSRAVGPPPASTINRAWLGKQGRGRVFIAQPALLFQKKHEQHTSNPPCAVTSHPHQQGLEMEASTTGTSRSFGAHHRSFHALSPKSAEEKAFCQQLQKGSCCKSSTASITLLRSPHTYPDALHSLPLLQERLFPK